MIVSKNFISEQEQLISISIQMLEEGNNILKSDNEILVCNDLLTLCIAKYSLALNFEEIKETVHKTVRYFHLYFKFSTFPEDYSDFIWLFSLAYLCGLDDEHMQKLIAIVKRDGIKDQLLDYLIRSYDPSYDGEAGQFLHPIPYGNLAPILNSTASDSDVAAIKNYLDKHWYQGHADEENFDASWIDLHKDALGRFFGYWAWETAAIAKIKGLDDELLKNHKYYPYRAVHW